MRELILDRINVIKVKENGFSTDTMRWYNFTISVGDIGDVHISHVDFRNLDDDDLLFHFERIIKRRNVQM